MMRVCRDVEPFNGAETTPIVPVKPRFVTEKSASDPQVFRGSETPYIFRIFEKSLTVAGPCHNYKRTRRNDCKGH